MGNLAPTRMAASTAGTTGSRCARVMLPGGLVRHMELPVTAAELMLEEPGHFLANERAMRRGRRVEAVRADTDLERGVLYAALPMKRLGSTAELADMARLAASGEQAPKGSTAKVIVTPLDLLVASAASGKEDAPAGPRTPRLDEMEVEDAVAAAEIEELKQRLDGGRRSKRLRMETIEEESYAPARR
ncbi:hypothetical protein ACP70R_038081 [Stipagrostis hirtigluma subsp. patula]